MKKQLLLLIMMLLPIVVNASYDINGINYDLDFESKTAEVTKKISRYSGDIVIPSLVKCYDVEFNVTSIGEDAFYQCGNLTSITIPCSIKYIKKNAFNFCLNLTSVTIPNNVAIIGEFAFANCTALTSIKIGSSVTNIGNYTFAYCKNLTDVYCYAEKKPESSSSIFDNTNINNGVLYVPESSIEIYNSHEVWGQFGTIQAIADESGTCGNNLTWNYIEATKTLTISGSGKMYDYDMIFGIPQSIITTPWASLCQDINSVILEDGVTNIGNHAFNNCSNMTSITIPSSVESIGEYAFQFCSKITSIIVPNNVNYIGVNAFRGCSSLLSFTIPAGVKEINYFSECTALEYVDVPNSITKISGFDECRNLKSIYIPEGVTSIGYHAFWGCSSLTSIVIPGTVTEFGQSSFQYCSGLTSVVLSEGITKIGYSAFENCRSLSKITLPKSLETIEGCAFRGCTMLPSIFIPEGVKAINNFVFVNCTNLDSISLPHSLTTIGNDVFYNCNKLAYVAAKMEEPLHITEKTFSNRSNAALFVLKRCKEKYASAAYWNEFKEITTIKHKITYIVDSEQYKEYELDETEGITPESEPTKEGYTFSGWSEIPEIMPDHEVTVTGSFTINKYKLTYLVDGEEYKTYDVEYGTAITPETAPTKEGYTFSGWSWIPSKMPAEDVTVTGTFTINKYKLTYMVNGENYKSYDVEYGQSITPEGEPTKEGYTFSGWSWIPSKMPAEDVTVTGTFTANHYKLIYMVDGAVYKSIDVACDDPITPEAEPTKEGYTFSGWSYIPKKMPAEDVTVTGTFSINSYKLTYMIDNEVYKETMYEYGATITPEPQPEGDYQTFEWTDLPQTMPAHDVTVYATYTSGIAEIVMMQGVLRIYGPDGKPRTELQKGLNIVRMSDGTTKKIVVK